MESLVAVLEAKTDCESKVKNELVQLLNNWKETPGFQLTKYNKEYVRILLEHYLLEDRETSNQVSQVLRDCLHCEANVSGPPLDLFGKH